MIIAFNLNKVGLSNNGGCRTIIKCAETLSGLGHEVYLFSPTNRYNWHQIRVPVVKSLPKCDVLVATGYRSCADTLRRKAKAKLYYIRGFETWIAPKAKLVESYRSLPCVVNSRWLQEYLNSKGVDAHLVYPGLDFETFYEEPDSKRKFLGALFHTRHKTKRHKDAMQIAERLGRKLVMLNRDIRNPNPRKLRRFYNSIDVWISPSELEGLHNCPMEAALCGAAIVATDHPRSGVADYAIDNETALLYPARDIKTACSKVNNLLTDAHLKASLKSSMTARLESVIGDRKHNMQSFVRIMEAQL
jgi:hypothetical protein